MNRGAATVELAIGATLWVTVTLLGLWMSEVSFLSTKVQETAAATVWDATGRKVDDYAVRDNAAGNADYSRAISGTTRDQTRRYGDFDGVESSSGRSGTARLLARGQALSARCIPGAGRTPLSFDSPASTQYDDGSGTSTPGRDNNVLRLLYKPRPATLCTASAWASPWQLPEHFLDEPGKGFYGTPLRGNGAIQLCGAGRAKNGACADGYAVLLGDWAVDGRAGSRVTQNLPLPLEGDTQRGNLPYRDMVERMFEVSGRDYGADTGTQKTGSGASQRFQRRMTNMKGVHNELNFYMSYAGVESNYGDMLAPDEPIPERCRKCHFNTTGTQTVNGNPDLPEAWRTDWRNLRRPCFLGIGGCPEP